MASQVSPPDSRGSRGRAPLVDDSYLAEMKKIYRAEDVDRAFAKMQAWLLTPKGSGKAASKLRFVRFLSDCEPLRSESKEKKEEGPEGWREIVATSCPDYNCPDSWGEVFPTIREGVLDEIRKRKSENKKEGAA